MRDLAYKVTKRHRDSNECFERDKVELQDKYFSHRAVDQCWLSQLLMTETLYISFKKVCPPDLKKKAITLKLFNLPICQGAGVYGE